MCRLNQINLSSVVELFCVCARAKKKYECEVAIYNQKGELNVMMWLRRRHQNVLHPYLIHLCIAIIQMVCVMDFSWNLHISDEISFNNYISAQIIIVDDKMWRISMFLLRNVDKWNMKKFCLDGSEHFIYVKTML